jgi:hypothetical protein
MSGLFEVEFTGENILKGGFFPKKKFRELCHGSRALTPWRVNNFDPSCGQEL